MFTGIHALMWSDDADVVRPFLRDVLELPAIDVGGEWLIFGLGRVEAAVHPAEEEHLARKDCSAQLYLMCDDVNATVAKLKKKGVELSRPITDEGYGLVCAIRLPDGQDLSIYEPRHPTALDLA